MSKHNTQLPTDLDIMMFLDGELTGEASKRVESFLENDEDAGAKAQCLGQISELIRGNMELAADSAEDKLAGLWAGIDSGIQQQMSTNGVSNAVSKGDAVIVPIESAAKKAESRATEELVKKANWFGGWQSHLMTGAIVAAAVAVLMVATRSETVQQTASSREVSTTAPDTIPVVLKSQAPEVENIEVYDGSATIMMTAGESADSSAVIWISNDTDLVEDPI